MSKHYLKSIDMKIMNNVISLPCIMLMLLAVSCTNSQDSAVENTERIDTIFENSVDTVMLESNEVPPKDLHKIVLQFRDTVVLKIKGTDTISRVVKKGVGQELK